MHTKWIWSRCMRAQLMQVWWVQHSMCQFVIWRDTHIHVGHIKAGTYLYPVYEFPVYMFGNSNPCYVYKNIYRCVCVCLCVRVCAAVACAARVCKVYEYMIWVSVECHYAWHVDNQCLHKHLKNRCEAPDGHVGRHDNFDVFVFDHFLVFLLAGAACNAHTCVHMCIIPCT